MKGNWFIATIALGSMIFTGCCNLRVMKPDDFKLVTDDIGQLQSGRYFEYIGVSHDRAYLQYNSNIDPLSERKVYYVPLDQLPKDLVKELKAGKNPWKKGMDAQRQWHHNQKL
ncbi:MAG: hypothetical protein MK193_00490 [Lentisphaeria bacterium]|nr:hypothetical protein [Lentisphaeria bacterium]